MLLTPSPRAHRETGFTLVEVLVALGILTVLTAIAIVTFGNVKQNGRANASKAHLAEAQVALQQARDRQQAPLAEILGGAGSAAACTMDPLPPVGQLSGSCRSAWDQVNARLAPFLGSQQAAAMMLTDGADRPILIDARESGCPARGADTLTSVHPTGVRSKAPQQVQLTPSNYAC